MLKNISDLKSSRHEIRDHAHAMGLTSTIVAYHSSDVLVFDIQVGMNSQIRNSYMHRDAGNLKITPTNDARRRGHEMKMIHDFWYGFLTALQAANPRSVAWTLSDRERAEVDLEPQIYPVHRFQVEELEFLGTLSGSRVVRITV